VEFTNEITNELGATPNPQQKITFIKNRFTILQNNLLNIYDRKSFEAVAITIKKQLLFIKN